MFGCSLPRNLVEEEVPVDEDNVMYNAYDEVASLLQGVAHEINNPVSVVKTNAKNLEMIVEKIGPALQRIAEEDPEFTVGPYGPDEALTQIEKQIRGIEDAARRISTVVDNFRDFSASANTEQAPLELNQIVESSVNMTRFQLDKVDSVNVETTGRDIQVLGHKM